MSRERAQRRAERLAVLEREKAVRARRAARRGRRQALMKRLRPRFGRDGRIDRRSPRQRFGIAVATALVLAVIWTLVPDLPLRIILTAILILAVPILVVVGLGRRS